MKKLYSLLAVLFVAVAANAADYYLIGGFNGWSTADPTCKFTAKADGVYELNYAGELTSGFKVNDGTWTNDEINFGSNGSKLVKGEPYAYGVGGSTGNIEMDGAISNPKVVLDLTAGTLTITGEEAEVEIGYQLWGSFTSTEWDGAIFEQIGDDEWTAYQECTVNGQFGIKELGNGVQTNWLAAASAGIPVAGNATGIVLTTTDTQDFTIYPNSEGYTFILHPAALTLDVKVGKSGIAEIEADTVAPVYYNLQGVRIAEPANGLFIEVRGNKAVKVIK